MLMINSLALWLQAEIAGFKPQQQALPCLSYIFLPTRFIRPIDRIIVAH